MEDDVWSKGSHEVGEPLPVAHITNASLDDPADILTVEFSSLEHGMKSCLGVIEDKNPCCSKFSAAQRKLRAT